MLRSHIFAVIIKPQCSSHLYTRKQELINNNKKKKEHLKFRSNLISDRNVTTNYLQFIIYLFVCLFLNDMHLFRHFFFSFTLGQTKCFKHVNSNSVRTVKFIPTCHYPQSLSERESLVYEALFPLPAPSWT